MRYVGHLDTMHYFQKAFRRTGLKLGFSKGFSPHMLLTFASPLSIGMTTTGDYLDIVIEEEMAAKEVLAKLSAQLGEGFEATDAVRLRDEAKTPMALLRAASYHIIPGSVSADTAEQIFGCVQSFMQQREISVMKKTKKGEKQEDIRPLIYHMCADSHSSDEGSGSSAVELMCASGSIEHLKPELVMDTLTHYASEHDPHLSAALRTQDKALMWRYHRSELYGVDPRILKPGDPLGDHTPIPLINIDTA